MSVQSGQVSTSLTSKDFIEKSSLMEKAAISLGLSIKKYREDTQYTEVIGTYQINRELLEVLAKDGFTFGPSRSRPDNGMVYLSGNSDQKGQKVFDSDSWAWEITEINPYLSIYLRLLAGEKEGGVVAIPEVWGNCSGGACHRPTINKFVVAIANYFPDVLPLLKSVTANSYPTIHWSDMGLGGVKSVFSLFADLYGNNGLVIKLVQSNLSPFVPHPILDGDRYFVPEPHQSKLLEQWRGQLQDFKDKLG